MLEHRHRYHLVVTNLLKFARFLWYLQLWHFNALLLTCDVTSIPHDLSFSIMLIRLFCTHYLNMFGFPCVLLFYLAYWKINFYFTPAKLYCQRLQSIQYKLPCCCRCRYFWYLLFLFVSSLSGDYFLGRLSSTTLLYVL